MDSIKILRKSLCWVGIIRWDSTLKGICFTIALRCVFPANFIAFLCTSLRFFLFAQKFDTDRAFSLICVMVSTFMFSWYMICLWNCNRLTDLFEDFDRIIEKSKNSNEDSVLSNSSNNNFDITIYEISSTKLGSKISLVQSVYCKFDNKMRTLFKARRIISFLWLLVFVVTPIVNTVYRYISSNYSKDSFRQPLYPWQ